MYINVMFKYLPPRTSTWSSPSDESDESPLNGTDRIWLARCTPPPTTNKPKKDWLSFSEEGKKGKVKDYLRL